MNTNNMKTKSTVEILVDQIIVKNQTYQLIKLMTFMKINIIIILLIENHTSVDKRVFIN